MLTSEVVCQSVPESHKLSERKMSCVKCKPVPQCLKRLGVRLEHDWGMWTTWVGDVCMRTNVGADAGGTENKKRICKFCSILTFLLGNKISQRAKATECVLQCGYMKISLSLFLIYIFFFLIPKVEWQKTICRGINQDHPQNKVRIPVFPGRLSRYAEKD